MVFAFDTTVVTGNNKGKICLWKGNSSDKGIKAHKKAVLCLKAAKGMYLFSGGSDGKVIQWE